MDRNRNASAPPGITSRRSLEQRKADLDVERMVRSQTHLLLDRIMNPNIAGIMAHIGAGRQISLTMGFVNPDGTPWVPPGTDEIVEVPNPPTRSDRIRGFVRNLGRR